MVLKIPVHCINSISTISTLPPTARPSWPSLYIPTAAPGTGGRGEKTEKQNQNWSGLARQLAQTQMINSVAELPLTQNPVTGRRHYQTCRDLRSKPGVCHSADHYNINFARSGVHSLVS
jgi:hypothetical protein